MKKRALLLLGLALLVLSCATVGVLQDSSKYFYEIHTSNWQTATVLFQCNGRILKREYQIDIGRVRRGSLDLSRCAGDRLFLVTLLARNDVFVGDLLQGWAEGSTLVIMIENYLPQTTYRIEVRPRT